MSVKTTAEFEKKPLPAPAVETAIVDVTAPTVGPDLTIEGSFEDVVKQLQSESEGIQSPHLPNPNPDAESRIKEIASKAKKGNFAFSPKELMDTEAATLAAGRILDMVSKGIAVRDILKTDDAKFVGQAAEQMGMIRGFQLISDAAANATVRAKYADQLEEHLLEFEIIVGQRADTNKALPNGGPNAWTYILTPDGSVVPEPHSTNAEAAVEFMALKKAASAGRVSDCGIAFAVVYRDGYQKLVKFAR